MSDKQTDRTEAAERDFLVVGIGASAGGLEACRKLLDGLPLETGMAFILVQHLDPAHESMMVDLLSDHTTMTVRQATDGMPLEREHLHVIPPGTYLSVEGGVLRLSPPRARHGARLPLDFLFFSLAHAVGSRAVGVILSGTGADGSLGVKAIKQYGGMVLVQDPAEAGYDGMPRAAIQSGAVDMVLPVARIPEALRRYDRRRTTIAARVDSSPTDGEVDWLPEVIELLRTRTPHDFTPYKPGTLRRRIERRMGLAEVAVDDVARYLDILRQNGDELDLLAKDLLINVTSFFRDTKVFEVLAAKIGPLLIDQRTSGQSLRIWIAGCSTGEETYSLAMLFREHLAATHGQLKLQIFASDVDGEAVAAARDGFYPESIAQDVSPERLAKFFVREEGGYRVTTDLRGCVAFAVQDVLADPPFSRLDFVSCRNLLIYLRAEAQAKVLSMFHFALREGGLLLLGNSETVSAPNDRFEAVAKAERLYRRIGRARPGDIGFATSEGVRVPSRLTQGSVPARPTAPADLCQRLVIEYHAPAAVLINHRHECLYSLGPTDRYLRVARGHASHDLFSMARSGLAGKLRAAIQRATLENAPITVPGGRVGEGDACASFGIVVHPVVNDGERYLLICFVDEPTSVPAPSRATEEPPDDPSRMVALERELQATREELDAAIRHLEIAAEEQRAVTEEALSVNEEYQTTNEELLTSKEELQSLNEELTALNSQLQETLERHRTAANDLQNVLHSTEVATIFLDTNLNIRLFTPATRLLFNVIPGDIGRPLADLSSMATDGELSADANAVLRSLMPIEREISTKNGTWYHRRVLPYRTQEGAVEGVVITFADITDRRRASDTLENARRHAEAATLAKSRFLAATSHDLRQPLQTLSLLQGLLAKAVEGAKERNLVARFEETLGVMSGMLNTLLDINQIETGAVRPEIVDFPINDTLMRLRSEFAFHPRASDLSVRVIPCGLTIRSDPRLLEQMVRNLLANAHKYTKHGKILLGCRRRDQLLSIEIWDTGIGIPNHELQAIFEEYHQLDNAARERSRGLGLGLAIVQRLADLLGHRVWVNSEPGKGSVFAIEVPLALGDTAKPHERSRGAIEEKLPEGAHRTGSILVIEDDPEVRDLIQLLLAEEGHHAVAAADGDGALELTARGVIQPDLILADFNLPNGMNGMEVAAALRDRLHRSIPAIILTGAASAPPFRDGADQIDVQLHKPVNLRALSRTVQRLLPPPSPCAAVARAVAGGAEPPTIVIIDDDDPLRAGLRDVLEDAGLAVAEFPTAEEFLRVRLPKGDGCLLIDAHLPGMSGLDLLGRLSDAGDAAPAIMITGGGDVSMAVRAMKAGAIDFIEKPVGTDELLACVDRALERSRDSAKASAWRENAVTHVAALTPRQREIMAMVLAGHPSKNIAADLGISQRTVENHRAAIMRKTGAKSLPALARLALAATGESTPE